MPKVGGIFALLVQLGVFLFVVVSVPLCFIFVYFVLPPRYLSVLLVLANKNQMIRRFQTNINQFKQHELHKKRIPESFTIAKLLIDLVWYMWCGGTVKFNFSIEYVQMHTCGRIFIGLKLAITSRYKFIKSHSTKWFKSKTQKFEVEDGAGRGCVGNILDDNLAKNVNHCN